jgi:pSer/pThr/pTyr-binding forkhead associated (FHA) protein
MSAQVIVKVTSGEAKGLEFEFTDSSMWTIGRHLDCSLRLSEPEISRRHCILDIDPPCVRVRDLGSLNGTFLNNVPIGKRAEEPDSPADEACQKQLFEVKSGDKIYLGRTVLRVKIQRCEEPEPQADVLEWAVL